MARVLVWPWHGPVRDNKVTLKDGSTRPYFNPVDFNVLGYGPGDTHRIVVPDVPPLTEEELARTPPGGEYWAGKAIISANTLYNAPLNGWIFQAPDGTRWRCGFSATNEGDVCRIQLIITPFGAFNTAPGETYYADLSFAVPQPDIQMRQLFGGDLTFRLRDVGIRLHAVSDSGTNAIVAATMFNDRSVARTADPLHHAYTFIKVSLVKNEEGVSATGEVLYGPDQLISRGPVPDYTAIRYGFSDMIEEDREPIVDSSGNHVGDTVTYSWDPTMVMVEIPYRDDPRELIGPVSYTRARKWILMVGFSGETPVPYTVQTTETASRALTTLSAVTVTKRIRREYFAGAIDTEQAGEVYVEGSGSSQGTFECRLSGPGGTWSRSCEWSTSAVIVDQAVQIFITFNGQESQFGEAAYAQVGMLGDGYLGPSGITRRPVVGCGIGSHDVNWQFDLYSNNCIGVSQSDNQTGSANGGQISQRFIGAYTPAGFLAHQQPYPGDDIRHYGSFNPVTEEFVIGSTVPVNWT